MCAPINSEIFEQSLGFEVVKIDNDCNGGYDSPVDAPYGEPIQRRMVEGRVDEEL